MHTGLVPPALLLPIGAEGSMLVHSEHHWSYLLEQCTIAGNPFLLFSFPLSDP